MHTSKIYIGAARTVGPKERAYGATTIAFGLFGLPAPFWLPELAPTAAAFGVAITLVGVLLVIVGVLCAFLEYHWEILKEEGALVARTTCLVFRRTRRFAFSEMASITVCRCRTCVDNEDPIYPVYLEGKQGARLFDLDGLGTRQEALGYAERISELTGVPLRDATECTPRWF